MSIGGFTYTGTDTGGVAFWGVIDTAVTFSKLSFTPTGESSNLLMDSVSYGAVPIPASAWLFGSGLLGLVGMARRKKAT